MMRLLAGIETEYGLAIEGQGANTQIQDSEAVVRISPDDGFFDGWDYSLESPRADLRGFKVERLTIDPRDAAYDQGQSYPSDREVRADRILRNGARFYNDHGHPEYATPECWSVAELALHDAAGQIAVRKAGLAYEAATGRRVKLYKNNTDYQGASYGTHESVQVPRRVGFENLYRAITPLLVSRIVFAGSGKAVAETGADCAFQMSQRADFFTERASVDTLHRRPIFNTRDEPHADSREWIRLHVIATDANMNAHVTRRKMALLKLGVMLAIEDAAPIWRLSDPMAAMRLVSRDLDGEGRIDLEGGSWTTPRHIIESILDEAEARLVLEPELDEAATEIRDILESRFSRPNEFARRVDWAAKRAILRQYEDEMDLKPGDPALLSVDLAFHDLGPEEGLFPALVEAGWVEPQPSLAELEVRLAGPTEPNRSLARAAAVTRLKEQIQCASWASIRFKSGEEVHLPPDLVYPEALSGVESVKEFIELLPRTP